jgi:very-short-patch-repair endonuclease
MVGLEIVLGDVDSQTEAVDTQWRISCETYVGGLVSDTIARNKASMLLLGQVRVHHGGVARVTQEVLQAARGWACTTLSLKQNFPLQASLFDYVIVDEASQCQLAYVLPAAYRAKRLIVVGDPNQLPPITNMDEKQEESLAMHNGLDFQTLEKRKITSVNYSAYDFFADVVGSDAIKLLNEHYRSHPEIARWFNESFYSSELKVLTDISNFDTDKRSIVWVDVVGNAEQPQNGSSWLNRAEADKAIDLLGELIEAGKTVGVVTPFRAQAERVRVLAQRKFSRELLHQAKFKSSTAHGFQGDERDVMIFSCVLADGVSPRAARWIQSERRLINVAVSRARERLIILGSPFISQYECATLTSLQEFVRTVDETDNDKIGVRFDSNAEKLLFQSLISVGVAPISKFNVEGYELDFGLLLGDHKYDIEVDGDSHYESTVGNHLRLRRQDITRDRILSRAGWTVIRVPAWECVSDSATVAQRILTIVQGDTATFQSM